MARSRPCSVNGCVNITERRYSPRWDFRSQKRAQERRTALGGQDRLARGLTWAWGGE